MSLACSELGRQLATCGPLTPDQIVYTGSFPLVLKVPEGAGPDQIVDALPGTVAELAAMPQTTHRLPIACVEVWSATADWTGVVLASFPGVAAAVLGQGGKARAIYGEDERFHLRAQT